MERNYSLIQNGQYKPKNCKSRQNVAILIPFRDRESHLRIFLNHMHPFLMRQQLQYGIYVVEQVIFFLLIDKKLATCILKIHNELANLKKKSKQP